MSTLPRRAAAIALLAALLGCVTAYEPRGHAGGYQERALGANTYYVEFLGNNHTSRDTVTAYWLHRCAELTLKEGFDHFVLLGNAPGAEPGSGGARILVSGVANNTWSAGGAIELGRGPAHGGLPALDARELLAKLGPAVRQASATRANVTVSEGLLEHGTRPLAPGSSSASKGLAALPPAGATWKYSFVDREYAIYRTFTVRVSSVTDRQVREIFQVESGPESTTDVNASGLRFVARRLMGDHAVVELSPYLRAAAVPDELAASYPASGSWKVSAPLVQQEDVVVPAGRFRTTRVDLSGSLPVHGSAGMAASANHLPARFHYTAWYAAEARRYVMIRHQTWNAHGRRIGDEVVELLEHEVR